jgi:hypothetical protein
VQTFISINIEEELENTEKEVDALLDYMDERVEDGADPEEVVVALAVVLALITGDNSENITLH